MTIKNITSSCTIFDGNSGREDASPTAAAARLQGANFSITAVSCYPAAG